MPLKHTKNQIKNVIHKNFLLESSNSLNMQRELKKSKIQDLIANIPNSINNN